MAYLISRRFRAAFAVLPVFALGQFFLVAPAAARVHSYAHAYHHHYLARREAAPADNFAQSTFGGQQDHQSPPSFNESASPIDGMAATAASAAGIPVSLVERVIKRESGGNPRAVSQGNYGLMQIRLGTARAMGYSGSAEGLLDAQTNMTYAVKYLAGAYRAAGGNESRAVAFYASGYYAQAKAQGFSPYQTAQANTSQPAFDSYQQEAAAPRYVQTKYQTKSQDRFDQTQYDQARYQQVRYDRAPRSRYVEASYNSGPFVAAAHQQYSETPADSGWQPGLYAYAPAHPLRYRARHYRHHAV
jgi:Transglycosylase SLT domain